jgi:hypothetical protein
MMGKNKYRRPSGKEIRRAQRRTRKERTDRRNARGDFKKLDLP